jgi:hypothetical protein
MVEFIISWIGIVVIIAAICQTVFACIKLHYINEKEKRLERFDRQLQGGKEPGNLLESGELGEMLEKAAYRTNNLTKFGDAALTECVRAGVVSEERARYIRV